MTLCMIVSEYLGLTMHLPLAVHDRDRDVRVDGTPGVGLLAFLGTRKQAAHKALQYKYILHTKQ